MTYILFDATLDVAEKLGTVKRGVCYTAAPNVNSFQDLEGYDEHTYPGYNYYMGGTVWITETPSNDANTNTFYRIKYSDPQGVIVLHDSFAVNLVDQSKYAAATKRYPMHRLIEAVNKALRDLGTIPIVDTSLTTVQDQTEYTLPVAAGLDVREIAVQTIKTSGNSQWKRLRNWTIQKDDAGVGDTLILDQQLDAGYTLRVTYMTIHPTLSDASDVIDEIVHPDRVVNSACAYLLLQRASFFGADDPTMNDRVSFFMQEAERAKSRYPIMTPHKPSRLLVI